MSLARHFALTQLTWTSVVSVHMDAGTAAFVAARDIPAGEQLCISYIDASMGVKMRQQKLEWGYGFQCKCEACTEDLKELS